MRGADKLLEPVEGVAMLGRQARMALQLGGTVLVTLPPRAEHRRKALDGLAVEVIEIPDAREGMAASLRSGVAALPADTQGVMILPADMPDLTLQDLRRLADGFAAAGDGAILRATSSDGRAGHPVIFPRSLFADFAALHGDQGARGILQRHADRVVLLALPGEHALTDLDTPESWAAWRARG